VFLNPAPEGPPTLNIFFVFYQTHLIQLFSSLEETQGPEMGVLQDRVEKHWFRCKKKSASLKKLVYHRLL